MPVVQKCASKMRFVAGIYCCGGCSRRTEQMRIYGNAKCRACCFCNYFTDGALGHRLSIDPKPKRFGVVCTTSEYRPIDFQVLVDSFANVLLYGPLVGSFFFGFGGC
jgi:hypothetical protein